MPREALVKTKEQIGELLGRNCHFLETHWDLSLLSVLPQKPEVVFVTAREPSSRAVSAFTHYSFQHKTTPVEGDVEDLVGYLRKCEEEAGEVCEYGERNILLQTLRGTKKHCSWLSANQLILGGNGGAGGGPVSIGKIMNRTKRVAGKVLFLVLEDLLESIHRAAEQLQAPETTIRTVLQKYEADGLNPQKFMRHSHTSSTQRTTFLSSRGNGTAQEGGLAPYVGADEALYRDIVGGFIYRDGARGGDLGVCVTLGMEQPAQVQEFVVRNQIAGVKLFILMDNTRPTGPGAGYHELLQSALQPFIDQNVVILHQKPLTTVGDYQTNMNWCISQLHSLKLTWGTVLDVDEILTPHLPAGGSGESPDRPLARMLRTATLRNDVAICLPWTMVGSDSYMRFPDKHSTLTEVFMNVCDDYGSPSAMIRARLQMERGRLKKGKFFKSIGRLKYVSSWKNAHLPNTHHCVDEWGGSDFNAKKATVELQHYFFRTFEDFALRVALRGVSGGGKNNRTYVFGEREEYDQILLLSMTKWLAFENRCRCSRGRRNEGALLVLDEVKRRMAQLPSVTVRDAWLAEARRVLKQQLRFSSSSSSSSSLPPSFESHLLKLVTPSNDNPRMVMDHLVGQPTLLCDINTPYDDFMKMLFDSLRPKFSTTELWDQTASSIFAI